MGLGQDESLDTMRSYSSRLMMFASATLYRHFLEQFLAPQGCSKFLNEAELVASLGAAFQTNSLKIRRVKVSASVDTPSPITCGLSLLAPPEPYDIVLSTSPQRTRMLHAHFDVYRHS